MSREIADQEAEADQLNTLVGSRAVDLARAAFGTSFRLGDADFSLHAKNRNTIYRIRGSHQWFLKLSPPVDLDVMPRERLGASYCNRVLHASAGYGGPFLTRVSLSPPYVLAEALKGPPLTRVVANDAWSPMSPVRLEAVFETLGTLLGTLHADRSLPSDAPEATKRPFDVVQTMAERIATQDATIQEIRNWSRAPRGERADQAFIHGNLRLDNLLLANGRIGFVDFENCGRGDRYQDASRPITHLLLLRTSLAVPTKRIDKVLATFLEAYGAAQPYDRGSLSDWVGVRLARYYLESHSRTWPGLIGGLPVVRSRLGALTRRILREGLSRSCALPLS